MVLQGCSKPPRVTLNPPISLHPNGTQLLSIVPEPDLSFISSSHGPTHDHTQSPSSTPMRGSSWHLHSLSHLNLEMASYNLTFPNSSSIPLGDWPDLRIAELILSRLHFAYQCHCQPEIQGSFILVSTPPPSSGLSHHLHSSCSAYSWEWTFLGLPCSHWFLFPDLM